MSYSLDFAVGIIIITTNFVIRMRCSSWLGSGQLKVNQRKEESNSINQGLAFVVGTRNIEECIKVLRIEIWKIPVVKRAHSSSRPIGNLC